MTGIYQSLPFLWQINPLIRPPESGWVWDTCTWIPQSKTAKSKVKIEERYPLLSPTEPYILHLLMVGKMMERLLLSFQNPSMEEMEDDDYPVRIRNCFHIWVPLQRIGNAHPSTPRSLTKTGRHCCGKNIMSQGSLICVFVGWVVFVFW